MCEENIFVKYKKVPGRKKQEYYDEIEAGVKAYFNGSGYKKITKEEPSSGDIEASYLCHGIWTRIMGNKYNNRRPQSGTSFYWNDQNNKESVLFHFDIMNNCKTRFFQNANNRKMEEWRNLYHTIGNMTPIPWFKLYNNSEIAINSQMLHKSLDERWDLYLQVIHDQWDRWMPKGSITFENYMTLTCQQMYYTDIYNDIKKNSNVEINLQTIDGWNKRIARQKNMKLLSFNQNEKNVDDVVNMIISLIKIRYDTIKIIFNEKIKGTKESSNINS